VNRRRQLAQRTNPSTLHHCHRKKIGSVGNCDTDRIVMRGKGFSILTGHAAEDHRWCRLPVSATRRTVTGPKKSCGDDRH
jgi:hypothetical protein